MSIPQEMISQQKVRESVTIGAVLEHVGALTTHSSLLMDLCRVGDLESAHVVKLWSEKHQVAEMLKLINPNCYTCNPIVFSCVEHDLYSNLYVDYFRRFHPLQSGGLGPQNCIKRRQDTWQLLVSCRQVSAMDGTTLPFSEYTMRADVWGDGSFMLIHLQKILAISYNLISWLVCLNLFDVVSCM